ncbi:DUF3572 domain-containing protein [Cohaesibacter sp. ES.047]|uniref:DUF3572 domain-containing protein n=1 Tax=Cohaesibacter sp. ES.047 TaxID=1798205 RepID=UPI001FCED5A0|nr:DUF3572 domain-containing protein [Cohaesibacter sp. ES.047]
MEEAEALAIDALGFLSSDVELMGRFLALSGLDPSDLHQVAAEPSFLAAILDFMLVDDALVLAFASNKGIAPEDIAAAKARLDPMSMATTGSY